MNEFCCISKIPYMLRAVAVAGKDDGDAVFSAAAQNFKIVCSGVAPVSVRGEGCFVDLEDDLFFFAQWASIS